MRMFDMSNDSHLFRTRPQLEALGGVLGPDGRFVVPIAPEPGEGDGQS